MMMLPLLTLFFLFPQPTICFNNQTDLLSLLVFKSRLNDPQGALTSWNQTTHFCTWNGVQCGHRHRDRVVTINLTSQGLVGTLSPHVGNLSFLRTIFLQNNTFLGQIPEEIGLLSRLELVEFSNNSFVGPIPQNLSHCTNLFYLNLMDNELSGTIPIELGSLSKLELLGLSLNKIAGHIPSTIGNITSLEALSLAECGLKGEIPESLARLRKLTFLQLSINNLTGTIPSALFNLSAIYQFSVAVNRLHGVIPSTIGLTLPYIEYLVLSDNQFDGPIPASIPNATLLKEIVVSGNYFTGPIPRVGTLTRLRFFVSDSNLIEDDIRFISLFTNCTNLEVLQIDDNPLAGSLPRSIANLSTRLNTLTTSSTKIQGNIPSGIGNLVGLTSLDLSHNHLEGPVPTGIAELSNLQFLSLSQNRLTNELPSSLGNLTSLNLLSLYENLFLGNLPSSIGNCTKLLELYLSNNNFNGLIPQEILSLSSLSISLDLSYNNFEGLIPNEIGSLTNLAELLLSNNRLSGLIPNSLSHCISLERLYLNGNLLEGEISSGLSALRGLRDLDLSRNNLSGPIPIFLGNLKLEYLNLSFNKLQGEVPTIGIFRNKTSISLDGNQRLCGGISKLNLLPCPPVKSGRAKLSIFLKILIPILAVGGICLVLLAFFTYKKKMSRENVSPLSPLVGVQFMRLSYGELLKATGGFAEANLLGTGRFGSVYKGILNDGKTLVAVKVLNLFVKGASKSFFAECNAFRDVRHRNLLKILSVCESIDFQGNDFKALVYEFKANGSLENWLYHKRDKDGGTNSETNNLNMIQRLNIAIDIAQAIEYLHFGTESSIVHGDLKPSNILLDHEMTACVGDFGLAKIISNAIPSHESSTSIGIRGTLGYVPPEYGTSQSMSTQGDVYSYGILLLEMFTNKRPTDDSFKDHVNLYGFVSAALPNCVQEIVDPLLQIEIDIKYGKAEDCMASILSIGVACSKETPGERMSIADVVNELHMIQKLLCS